MGELNNTVSMSEFIDKLYDLKEYELLEDFIMRRVYAYRKNEDYKSETDLICKTHEVKVNQIGMEPASEGTTFYLC